MTGRKDVLVELLAKVEAEAVLGKFGPIMRGHWDFDTQFLAMKAYNGSLDAAKALHEAVLPEWHWNVSKDGVARIVIPSRLRTIPTVGRSDSSTARAWLLAILKALIAGENTNNNDKGDD
jgi:hypothetical protein